MVPNIVISSPTTMVTLEGWGDGILMEISSIKVTLVTSPNLHPGSLATSRDTAGLAESG